MPSSGLFGSYPLISTKIDEVVAGKGAGAYALGNDKSDGFHIQRVGRSDTDLNARLHTYVGENYRAFKYAFYESAKLAFEKECRLYHDFNPEDNFVHPDKPDGTNYTCPVCGG